MTIDVRSVERSDGFDMHWITISTSHQIHRLIRPQANSVPARIEIS